MKAISIERWINDGQYTREGRYTIRIYLVGGITRIEGGSHFTWNPRLQRAWKISRFED